MAGRIRAEDIEAVRERADLAKLVSQYLTLKKAGHDSLVGLCPFHTEKTPSFSVSPSKQVYYCFGCGAGGDAVRFLQEVENLTFREAIERLANDTGVKLRFEGESPAERRAASRRTALHRANEEAAKLYHSMLLEGREGKDARAYLEERGIDKDAGARFDVGYAPGYADFLLRRMARQFSSELLVEAGLVSKDAEGALRDRFRGRITFPIHDLSGRAVGFGGRILPADDTKAAKYINTSESPVYRKGELLYNLHRAKGAITKSAEVFVVEGYTDVIALAQAEIENAVATCGTALSEGHLRLLSRFAQRAVLAFDSDEAGARAAERAFAIHEEFPVRLEVLIVPDGLDPADYVQKHGGDAFRKQAKLARPLVEYMIRRTVERHDLSTVEGQTQAVDAAFPVIESLKDPVRRQEYAHELAGLAGVSEGSVMLKLERRAVGAPAGGAQPARRISVQERVEREMLKLFARNADTVREFAGRITEEHFQSAPNRKLYGSVVGSGGDIRSLIAATDDDQLVRSLSQLAVEPVEGDPTSEYAESVARRLEELLLQRRSSDMRRRLQKLRPDDPQYDGLFQELITLDGELRRLREAAPAE